MGKTYQLEKMERNRTGNFMIGKERRTDIHHFFYWKLLTINFMYRILVDNFQVLELQNEADVGEAAAGSKA